jgi:hypothetical protein
VTPGSPGADFERIPWETYFWTSGFNPQTLLVTLSQRVRQVEAREEN